MNGTKAANTANAIDAAAETLRGSEGAFAFTRRNLFYALNRGHEEPMSEASFDSALRRRLARGALSGLLPAECRWRWSAVRDAPRTLVPDGILLLDRRAIFDLFVASGVVASARLAVVCLDGSPAPVVAWLRRVAREVCAREVPVMYLHDSATVAYPFMVEPLATLVANTGSEPFVYSDLGLPPLGTTARRFGDTTLAPEEIVTELEAIPPSALVHHCATEMRGLARNEPGAAPLPLRPIRVRDGVGPRRARSR